MGKERRRAAFLSSRKRGFFDVFFNKKYMSPKQQAERCVESCESSVGLYKNFFQDLKDVDFWENKRKILRVLEEVAGINCADKQKGATDGEEGEMERKIPFSNEFRYIGYHLLKASCSQDNAGDEEKVLHLIRARSHADRVMYDIRETYIMLYADLALAIERTFKGYEDVVNICYPGYISGLCQVYNARDLFYSACKQGKDSQEYEERAKQYKSDLSTFVAGFAESAEMVAKEIKKRKKSNKQRLLKVVILPVIVGVIASLW